MILCCRSNFTRRNKIPKKYIYKYIEDEAEGKETKERKKI